MHLSTLLPPVLALAASTAFAADASDVIDLTASNFGSTVNPEPIILVEFFAPWCGHCKALAPHYEEAATALKSKSIPIAKVDCVDQAELCQQHGVAGYPTLKVFRNGEPNDYTGPRKADGIISYMTKQALPAVTEVTDANHEEFKGADKVVVVAYVSSTSDAPVPAFSQTANKHRDEYLFGITSDAKVIEAAGVKTPAIVIYRKFDEPRIDYTKDAAAVSAEELGAFIKESSVPLMDEVSADNYQTYVASGLPMAYVFLDPSLDTKDSIVESLKPVAREHKGAVNFVWIDAIKFGDHAKALNLVEPKWPSFVIQNLDKQLKYPLSQDAELTAKAVGAFVADVVAGKVEPSLKSEAVPESQDESVYTLVGSEFDQIVFDEDKDVFVEFYAPWCGHCKRLKPTWDSLADRYVDIKERITIAKMDATENDLPPSVDFRVSGFPTLKFKPAGARTFVDYNGDRSLESLIEFVEAQAKNPLDPAAAFKGKKQSSAKVPPPEAAQTPLDTHDEL